MDADKIERRLQRIDAAVVRTERRLATLAAVRDRHEATVTSAIAAAEASRLHFVDAARAAFRDPYKALKAWERHEWRLSKLTVAEPDVAEVANGAHASVTGSTGLKGLTLRGRTILGRDDPERMAARDALKGMGEERAKWLQSVRRARTYAHAINQVGSEIGQVKNRLRDVAVRRAELVEELMAQGRSPAPQKQRPNERDPETGEPYLSRSDEELAELEEMHRAYRDILEGDVPEPAKKQTVDITLTPKERADLERRRLEQVYRRNRERIGDLDIDL